MCIRDRALTAQNTTGVTDIMEVTPKFLAEQLDSIFTDIHPDAVSYTHLDVYKRQAMILEAYLPASEDESIERLRYLAPWLSRTEAASLIDVYKRQRWRLTLRQRLNAWAWEHGILSGNRMMWMLSGSG